MKRIVILSSVFIFLVLHSFAQSGWSECNVPSVIMQGRTDDIFMSDTQIGYACNSGYILKTIDGGNNWITIKIDTMYHRSVEFVNTQKGFVGSFDRYLQGSNILIKTLDGGSTWTDLTPILDVRARGGICGMAIPDSNTIYGCGNYYQDSAYIVKSIDGGNTWSFIDMHTYATSLIDMHFLNKDTGFATGKGPLPLEAAVILYTTDGGQSWTYKFQDTVSFSYCWKIQHLTDQIYYASIEDWDVSQRGRILKSTDGGITWNIQIVPYLVFGQGLQGIGFIDSLVGLTGGDSWPTILTVDGGVSWDTTSICPRVNRVLRVNDTLLFASGHGIWKYSPTSTGIQSVSGSITPSVLLNCYPSPANKYLKVDINFIHSTHALILLLDIRGRRVKVIENGDKEKGNYQYQIDTDNLPKGIYFVVAKTHEDQQSAGVIVEH